MKNFYFLIFLIFSFSFSVFAKNQTTEEDVNKAYKNFMEKAKSESMKKDLTRVYNCYLKFKKGNEIDLYEYYGVYVGFDESDLDKGIEFLKSLKKVHKKYGDNNCIFIQRGSYSDITDESGATLSLRMVFHGNTLGTINDRIAHLDEMIKIDQRWKKRDEMKKNNQRKIDSL